MLQIHNSLTGKKQAFAPIRPPEVRMYVCGLTVYDYMHLGHARMLVVFDTVARWLRASGYHLTYVRNITDIDDKIIRRAAENHESIRQLTERFIRCSHEDEAALGVLRPDVEPRATQSIDAIVHMVDALVKDGYAYQGANGDVYYAVSRFKNYGRLSGKRLEDLRVGARVEVDEAKRDPLDFVLWKAAKPGEPAWPSPWGPGRPGWHIECSAMSTAALGNHFDIHGGGMDLKFPHHENEIAQSEAVTGEHFVNVWMHNGFVNVDEEKMSKSLGNFFTVREVLKKYRPEVVRYFILNSHYRSPLNYNDQSLDAAAAGLARLYTALRGITTAVAPQESEFRIRFTAAMNDDFNTPVAISVLFDLAREINRRREAGESVGELAGLLVEMSEVLGLLQTDPNAYLQGEPLAISDSLAISAQITSGELGIAKEYIESQIKQRNAARKARNWKEADRIRDELAANGILIEDGASGTSWRRK
ncbi:MAG: cysteine--tRNA ligase [Gammaproteobacteria bacterium]|nr:cysteine--tRNA ligase [Gammaproteobacteria bacterium]MBU6509556.1 cysteine--tRNA ligase [Gammaproteobacteria bacterium]MDE1983413.1 cysteine--tRNA ligase [Gammaproteobacteria bacterium]MDE2108956.1 cysteine--tRNA ligase [Gammaproteobacteria bacterium]MDE2461806.1 cysteine--tRNA ligase [Gammaproteobacteria bacterium]